MFPAPWCGHHLPKTAIRSRKLFGTAAKLLRSHGTWQEIANESNGTATPMFPFRSGGRDYLWSKKNGTIKVILVARLGEAALFVSPFTTAIRSVKRLWQPTAILSAQTGYWTAPL